MSMSRPELEALLVLVDTVLRSCPDMLTPAQERTLQEFLGARPGEPSPERQLLEALDHYALSHHLTIDMDAEMPLPSMRR